MNVQNVKLTFVKSKNVFKLSFSLDDLGVQYFCFSLHNFIYAYNSNKKNVAETLSTFYPNISKADRFVFNNYVINPSILHKLKSRKSYASIPLNKKILIKAKRGINNKSYDKRVECSQDEIDRCKQNMSVALKKAKKFNDMNWFELYLESALELEIALNNKAKNTKPSKKFSDQTWKNFLKELKS